jgi:hypothetical protein
MPNWLIKSALQRGFSWLPNPHFWNRLFQSTFTKSTSLSRETFERKVRECHRHFQAGSAVKPSKPDFTVFELGTGWFPIIPIGLYLCGAKTVWTIDISDLLTPSAINTVLQYYEECSRSSLLKTLLPALRTDRLEALMQVKAAANTEAPASFLERLNIRAIVADAQKTPIPDKSIDLHLSSGVLEYIPKPILKNIIAEARRVAEPGAIASHRLNLMDQFSYFDKSISPLNFLRYPAKRWRWLDSPLTTQNRLRISDYREMFTEQGYRVLLEENILGRDADLDRITLAPEFRNYKRQDLLVLESFLVCQFP